MCLTSSWSSSSICWALVRRPSAFSLSMICYSVGGIFKARSLSNSNILCFLALAAAMAESFCSSRSLLCCISCSLVWILVAAFILSSSSCLRTMASDFWPFSVFSRISLNWSFVKVTAPVSPAFFFVLPICSNELWVNIQIFRICQLSSPFLILSNNF